MSNISDYYLYLRTATEQDLEMIHMWRTNPVINEMCGTGKELPTWEESRIWWDNKPDSVMLMAMIVTESVFSLYWKGRNIGVVWCDDISAKIPLVEGFVGNTEFHNTPVQMRIFQLAGEAIKKMCGKSQTVVEMDSNNEQLVKMCMSNGFVTAKKKDNKTYMVYTCR